MDILHLVDRLEELVAEARRMPIGQGVVIDRRRILELVDQMRSSVPWEVREARDVVTDRDAILEEARREADGILGKAELQARDMLEENSLSQQAERQAQQVIERAEQRAQDILDQAHEQVQSRLRQAEFAANNQMDEADRYALEMLRRLDQQLSAFTATIRGGIDALEERTGEGQPPQPDPQQPEQGYYEEEDPRR
jgi:vacuolar-type H+-ATPase subunit H